MKEMLINIPFDSIKKYENNPRKISKEKKEQLKNSIHDLTYLDPIIVDENLEIISGHQRFEALKDMGYENIPDLIKITGLTDEQKKKARIVLNVNHGQFDFEKLDVELKQIDFDMGEYGLNCSKDDSINDEKEEAEPQESKKLITCPECGEKF